MSGSQETLTDTEIRSRVRNQMLGLLNLLMWHFNQSLQLAHLSVLCLDHTYDLTTFLLLSQVERALRGQWLCHCLTTHLDFCLLLSVWLMMTSTLSTGSDTLAYRIFWDPAQASSLLLSLSRQHCTPNGEPFFQGFLHRTDCTQVRNWFLFFICQ